MIVSNSPSVPLLYVLSCGGSRDHHWAFTSSPHDPLADASYVLAHSMSKRLSTSSGRHVKRAMKATLPNSMRLSMLWTMKKFASLCVRFSKRKYYYLTPLQLMAWTGRRDKRGLPICLST